MPAVTTSFEQLLEQYLEPIRDEFHYPAVRSGHLDVDRFLYWTGEADYHHPVAGARVLCSGCGSGGDMLHFRRRGARLVLGLELDHALTRLAHARLEAEHGPPYLACVYDGAAVPAADGSLDIAFSVHVIEHTERPIAYMGELIRVLKPGGLLYLDLPSRYFWREQHTDIAFVHYLPEPLRTVLLRLARRIASPVMSAPLRQKLLALERFRFPSPAQVVRYLARKAKAGDVELIVAYLHGPGPPLFWHDRWKGANPLRLILRRRSFRVLVSRRVDAGRKPGQDPRM